MENKNNKRHPIAIASENCAGKRNAKLTTTFFVRMDAIAYSWTKY